MTTSIAKLQLVKRKASWGEEEQFLDFLVDGISLRERTGGYGPKATPLGRWSHEHVGRYVASLLGEEVGEMDSGRVPLYVCEECGDVNCGTVAVRVTLEKDHVTWSDFAREVNYSIDEPGDQNELLAIPSMTFDRRDYVEAIQKATTMDDESSPEALDPNGATKMFIRLNVDDDGWPPYSVESIWVETLGRNRYRVDNTPFFAFGIAVGDIVRAKKKHEVLWFKKRLQSSGFNSVRIIVMPDGPLAGDLEQAMKLIAPFGVGGERFPDLCLIALDVPPDVNLPSFKAFLIDHAENGYWEYEEAAITKQWQKA